jgi:hypothetical protein
LTCSAAEGSATTSLTSVDSTVASVSFCCTVLQFLSV